MRCFCRLVPIVKSIIFLDRNGLALRGKKDFGAISIDSEFLCSEGNFRNLLKFRVDAGDESLKNHLETFKKNASYLSPQVQNSIIESCGDIILESVLCEVKKVLTF